MDVETHIERTVNDFECPPAKQPIERARISITEDLSWHSIRAR